MKGYWHFVALSVGMSSLTIILNNNWFIIGYFLWLFYLYYHERLGKLPLIVSLIFFLFFIIYIPSNEVDLNSMTLQPQQHNPLVGEIISPISISNKKIDFVLQEKQFNNNILIIYFLNDKQLQSDYSNLKHGATCEVKGKAELPAHSRNPGQFDYQNYLLSSGITYQLIVDSMEDIKCEGASFMNHIYSVRITLINYVIKKMSPETASWLNALVLGDDSLLSEDIVHLFQRWSLSHILAISGLHVGLIVALVYFILVKLTIVTREKAQWIMMIFLPLYAFIAGGEPSVWRASTMVFLFITLNKTKLKLSVTDTLSIVFLLLIFFDKYIVYHIGFQLSFIVTLGLILTRTLIAQSTSSFFIVLQISFVSQMMILPLQFTYFSTFQPLSILLNALVVPYFSLLVIPLMFIMLLFSPLPYFIIKIIDSFFVQIHDLFLKCIYFIDLIADTPLVLGDIPILIIVIYYGLFFLLMKNLQMDKLVTAFKYGCMITGLIICTALRPYFSPHGTVTMLDIGQGDAFVIELPYRKGVFLIDAGSGFSFDDMEPTKTVYEQIIKPFLYSKGISKIDAIFLSHEHVDHVGSVTFLIEDIKVDEIIISNYYVLDDQTEKQLIKHGIDVSKVEVDEVITLRGQQFHVLAPSKDVAANENSLVLYTYLGGKYWLFTGDIYKNTEKGIIHQYNDLPVDVLKVAHHGSNTSTDQAFIKKISPDYALIPVGIKNRYGHPTTEVLKTLEEESIIILRTDLHGAVQYQFHKNEGTFFKYLP